jgi:hypothetical protein
MKRLLRTLAPLALFGLPGCLYAHYKGPLDTNLDQTKLGNKVGTSSAQGVLWMVVWGDAGTQAAAMNGGITTLNHADYEIFEILYGLYFKQTTIVYGD